jgi:hypothetical protein
MDVRTSLVFWLLLTVYHMLQMYFRLSRRRVENCACVLLFSILFIERHFIEIFVPNYRWVPHLFYTDKKENQISKFRLEQLQSHV